MIGRLMKAGSLLCICLTIWLCVGSQSVSGLRGGLSCSDTIVHGTLMAYQASPNRLEYLMQLHRQNSVVPFLFDLEDVLQALLSMKEDDRSLIYSCFSDKGFQFGSQLQYANAAVFDALYSERFNSTSYDTFKSRFVPPLDCRQPLLNPSIQTGYQQQQHASLKETYYLTHLMECRLVSDAESLPAIAQANIAYEGLAEMDPWLTPLYTMGSLVQGSYLERAFDAWMTSMVAQGSYLGKTDWCQLKVEGGVGKALRALNTRAYRSFLVLLYSAPGKISAQKKAFYSLNWATWTDWSPLFEPRWAALVNRIVESERALGNLTTYTSFLQISSLVDSNEPAGLLSLIAPLSLVEIQKAGLSLGPLILRLLSLSDFQSLSLSRNNRYEMKDNIQVLAAMLHDSLSVQLYPKAALDFIDKLATQVSKGLKSVVLHDLLANLTITDLRPTLALRTPCAQSILDLFLDGRLSPALYAQVQASDLSLLLSVDAQAGKGREMAWIAFIARMNESEPSHALHLASLKRCDMEALAMTESEASKKILALLADASPKLTLADFSLAPSSAARSRWLQIGYLDTLDIYTHLTQAHLIDLMEAGPLDPTPSAQNDSHSKALAQALHSQGLHVSQLVEEPSQRVSTEVLSALLEKYEMHPEISVLKSLLLSVDSSPSSPQQATKNPPVMHSDGGRAAHMAGTSLVYVCVSAAFLLCICALS